MTDNTILTKRALLDQILRNQGAIMATLDEVKAALATLQTDEAGITEELQAIVTSLLALTNRIAELEAQIASGGGVTAADLDAIKATISDTAAALEAATQSAKSVTGVVPPDVT
jgi:septal ring factor EnvC (AmiA/AmiB activator)